MNTKSRWPIYYLVLTSFFILNTVIWVLIDNSPPAWDQSLYLNQLIFTHNEYIASGFRGYLNAILSVDTGRVPLILISSIPAFLLPLDLSKSVLIIESANWILLAWAVYGLSGFIYGFENRAKIAFIALFLYGINPLTIYLTHNYLVEFLLISIIGCSYNCLFNYYNFKWSILAGIFIGLGFLTKVTYPVYMLGILPMLFLGLRNFPTKIFRYSFPGILIALLICGPYYFYNIESIILSTKNLSSSEQASLYGFADIFDINYILEFINSFYYNNIHVISIVFIGLIFIAFDKKIKFSNIIIKNKLVYISLILWVLVPFFMVLLSPIKEYRYFFPGVLPFYLLSSYFIFITVYKLSNKLLIFIFICFLANYLFLLEPLKLGRGHIFTQTILSTDLPDQSDWKISNLIQSLDSEFSSKDQNRNLLFLGGNRYFHINLLYYYMSNIGVRRMNIISLPYYSNRYMTVDDAIDFIEKQNTSIIIYKDKENWPAFSSRLNADVINKLTNNYGYITKDLNITQPDGSRFFILLKPETIYLDLIDTNEIVGEWKAGSGVGSIKIIDAQIKITTENNITAEGNIVNGSLCVTAWNVCSKISENKKILLWTNGFSWTRK